jgi:hypothetical protein
MRVSVATSCSLTVRADGAHIDSGTITVLAIDPTNPIGLQVDMSHGGAVSDEQTRKVRAPVALMAVACRLWGVMLDAQSRACAR